MELTKLDSVRILGTIQGVSEGSVYIGKLMVSVIVRQKTYEHLSNSEILQGWICLNLESKCTANGKKEREIGDCSFYFPLNLLFKRQVCFT